MAWPIASLSYSSFFAYEKAVIHKRDLIKLSMGVNTIKMDTPQLVTSAGDHNQGMSG